MPCQSQIGNTCARLSGMLIFSEAFFFYFTRTHATLVCYFFCKFFFYSTFVVVMFCATVPPNDCVIVHPIYERIPVCYLNVYNLLGRVCIEKRGSLGGTCLDVKCKCI